MPPYLLGTVRRGVRGSSVTARHVVALVCDLDNQDRTVGRGSPPKPSLSKIGGKKSRHPRNGRQVHRAHSKYESPRLDGSINLPKLTRFLADIYLPGIFRRIRRASTLLPVQNSRPKMELPSYFWERISSNVSASQLLAAAVTLVNLAARDQTASPM